MKNIIPGLDLRISSNQKKQWEIKDIDALYIVKSEKEEKYIGGTQEWYPTQWQRLSGCGPTTAANIFYYLSQKVLKSDEGRCFQDKCIQLMEEIWNFVTPTEKGIPSTTLWLQGVKNWLEYKEYSYQADYLDILPMTDITQEEVVNFLSNALKNDIPVAFLNLDAGEESTLDSWHWVTIVALRKINLNQAMVLIVDNGELKEINLSLWLSSSKCGGGFAWFSIV